MPESHSQHPAGVRLFRWFARPLFRAIYRTAARVNVSGLEHVPPRGSYLIVFNHLAIYDPPLVLAFWPYAAEALGAANMMDTFFIGHIMRWYGTIRVHRGDYDRRLLTIALDLLRAGCPTLIAPEGGRSHTPGMRLAKPGAAYLALKADVPLVPVGVIGTEALFSGWRPDRRPVLTMRVGESFRLPQVSLAGPERRQHLAGASEIIMDHIAVLLPPEYRGVYE